MDSIEDSHRALRLLDEISKGGAMTQRDLSRRAGVALGLVNAYLKNLAAKGCVKISGIPARRYKYYLTPKGFMEKSRLTYVLLQNYTRIFRDARADYARLFRELYGKGVRGVHFAGVDEVAEIAYLSLQEVDVEFLGAFDSGGAGEKFFRKNIMTFEELGDPARGDYVITTYHGKDAVHGRLLQAGIDEHRIHSIYPLARRGNGG